MSGGDPGFPAGRGHGPRRGVWTPRRLHFANFVCQNERIWTFGGGRAPMDVFPVTIGGNNTKPFPLHSDGFRIGRKGTFHLLS